MFKQEYCEQTHSVSPEGFIPKALFLTESDKNKKMILSKQSLRVKVRIQEYWNDVDQKKDISCETIVERFIEF